MTSQGIDVSLEDRWLILGTTGTGKTTFSKELLRHLFQFYPQTPAYILDSKADNDFAKWHAGLVISDDPPDLIENGVQVWQPGIDDQGAYDAWFDAILHAPGAAIVLIDEISSLKKGKGNEAPPGFQRLLKQGRSKGKTVINCTQEMAYNPRQIVTQTTHKVRFRMGGAFDMREANKLIGREGSDPEPAHEHGFFYRRADRLSALVEYHSYRDFF